MSHPIENLKFEDDKKEVKRPKPLQKPKSKVSKPKPKHIPKSSKTSETDSMSINADESFAGCERNSETVVVVRAVSGGPDDLLCLPRAEQHEESARRVCLVGGQHIHLLFKFRVDKLKPQPGDSLAYSV